MKWKVAVLVVVPVEEPAFLVSVKRIVGGVHVKDDLPRRLREATDEQLDQKVANLIDFGPDAVIPVLPGRGAAVLKTVQCALAGQRNASVPIRAELKHRAT